VVGSLVSRDHINVKTTSRLYMQPSVALFVASLLICRDDLVPFFDLCVLTTWNCAERETELTEAVGSAGSGRLLYSDS